MARRRICWILAAAALVGIGCGLFPSVAELGPADTQPPVEAGGTTIQLIQQLTIAAAPPAKIAFPVALAAGDGVVVCAAFPLALGSLEVDDSLSQTYALVGTQDGVRHLATYRQAVLAAFDGPGGLDTITLTTTNATLADGGVAQVEVYAFEYRGIHAIDGTWTNDGIVDGGSADVYLPWDGGTVAASEGGLVFAFVEGASGARLDTPFTTRTNFHGNAVGDELAGTAGAYAVTGTANDDWVLIAASFHGP